MHPLVHRPFHDGSALFSPPGRNAPPLRIVVAVAHPDDETIVLGALMPSLAHATFVYATDGAPRRLADARATGFGSCRRYARARREELESVFAIAGVDIGRSHFFEIPDQDAAHELAGLTRRIKRILEQARAALVITHPYEGGHPDHDATAFAVHNACRLLAAEKQPVPRVLEAPYYHNRGGRMATGDFLPRAGDGSQAVTLSGEERALKSRLLGCFATQEQTLRTFPTDRQCFRPAPAYDFERLPHARHPAVRSVRLGLDGSAVAAPRPLGPSRARIAAHRSDGRGWVRLTVLNVAYPLAPVGHFVGLNAKTMRWSLGGRPATAHLAEWRRHRPAAYRRVGLVPPEAATS